MRYIKLEDIIETDVSHDPSIKKKIILEKNTVPKLMNLGKATLKPGQCTTKHKHNTMYEIFYVLSGKAKFNIEGKSFEIEKEQCILIEPRETHSQSNPYKKNVDLLYFGISTE